MTVEEAVKDSVVSAFVAHLKSSSLQNIGLVMQLLCYSFLLLALILFAVLDKMLVVLVSVEESFRLLIC